MYHRDQFQAAAVRVTGTFWFPVQRTGLLAVPRGAVCAVTCLEKQCTPSCKNASGLKHVPTILASASPRVFAGHWWTAVSGQWP